MPERLPTEENPEAQAEAVRSRQENWFGRARRVSDAVDIFAKVGITYGAINAGLEGMNPILAGGLGGAAFLVSEAIKRCIVGRRPQS